MRKYLFLFFLLATVSAFGQKQGHAEFNFASPSSLNPSVTPASSGITVDVTDKTFTDGLATISFERGSQRTGVALTTQTDLQGNPVSYFLALTKSSSMTIKVRNGATIESIVFSSSHIGDFDLTPGQPGLLDPASRKQWTKNNDSDITSVTFDNNGDNSNITKIQVNYTEPINILEPTRVTPQYEVASFKDLTLAFSSNMTRVGASNLSIKNGTKSYPLSVDIKNSEIVLSTAETIATDGTYTISIPAGYFQNSEGYRNKALNYTIVISTPKNTLNYVSVNPVTEETEKLTSPITLTYDTYLKLSSEKLMMQKDGVDFAYVTLEKSSTNYKEVNISFVDIPEVITEKGIYTIKVPEGVIYDNLEKTYNPEFTLTYKVGYKPAPVYTETMKTAMALVAKTGVGYPTAESDSRKALLTLTNSEDVPTDEILQSAINAFYAETNVELPSIGKWYYISNISTTGIASYITVKDNTLGLTTKKSEATPFEVVEPMLFKTINNKYLFTASIEDNAENKSLTLAKLNVKDVDFQKTFGYFSVYGYYETTKSGDVLNAFASVNSFENQISTDDHDTAPVFNTKYSSAYSFTETSKPSEKPIVVELASTLSPTVLTEDNGVLEIQFATEENLEINDNTAAYLANEEGKRMVGITFFADESDKNVFKTSVEGLQNAKYQIVLPEGTFKYSANGNTYINKAMAMSFEVNKSSETPDQPENPDKPGQHGDNKAFNHDFDGYIYYPQTIRISYNDFNNFCICGEDDNFFVDTTIKVELKQLDANRTIRTGHFQKIDTFPTIEDCKTAYKLVLDEPIKEGDLREGETYNFVMQPATFGDSYFNRYINGESGISASQCHVNQIQYGTYINDKSTGIKEITSDSSKEAVIYDLMGRRVQSMSRPGIYIVNGKKVIKK